MRSKSCELFQFQTDLTLELEFRYSRVEVVAESQAGTVDSFQEL